jgi:PAS domain S-box-containing protein
MLDEEQRPPAGPVDPTPADEIPVPAMTRWPHRSETQERIEAEQRRRAIRAQGRDPAAAPPQPRDLNLINVAFAGLCEAVRDYAIFIMNADDIIVYWGMGAHLMKWWTREEAEGGHLRMLYPEGGSEDGTAEDHLYQAAVAGEYVGEGQRVRRGGSTFWGHITLTALRDPNGTLIGFAKVTQDLTKRRAMEAAVALANEAQSSREAAVATAEEAEFARQRAEEARLRAEQARERAEQAAEVARAQARSAKEQIAAMRRESTAVDQLKRVVTGAEPDAYMKLFAGGDAELEGGIPSDAPADR